jgi:hypothetical protein
MPAPTCALIRQGSWLTLFVCCSQLTYRFNLWCSLKDDSLESFPSASDSTGQAAKTCTDDDDLDLALHHETELIRYDQKVC